VAQFLQARLCGSVGMLLLHLLHLLHGVLLSAEGGDYIGTNERLRCVL
jgi:hypothetical protein